MSLFKKKTADEKLFDDPLEKVLQSVRKKYPVKKYILKEDINESLYNQSLIIFKELKNKNDFSESLYSYITFHQIYFHMKNYLLIKKRKLHGYKEEFIDVFYEYFIDNYLIFREMSELIDASVFKNRDFFFHVWFDGYFITFFDKILSNKDGSGKHNQPHLFFLIMLFAALERISAGYKNIVFSHILTLTESTEADLIIGLELLDSLSFKNPLKRKNNYLVSKFLLVVFDLVVAIDENDHLMFEDLGKEKCVEFIKFLISNTNLMINLINRIRNNLLTSDNHS